MSDSKYHTPHIAWVDLTVTNASEVRDFYAEILGYRPEPVEMGGYSDYTMVHPVSRQAVLGICSRKGPNANLPATWILYFTVPDLQSAIHKAVEMGAKILDGPRDGFCVFQDPGGAVSAFYQSPVESE